MNFGNEPRFPGSVRALACWLRRLAATDFSGEAKSRHNNLSARQTRCEKVRDGEAPSSAREGACAPQILALRRY
jgi:hypothetical protein